MKDKGGLRKADFWTIILLFVLGVAIIGGATSFPMTESYGGVQSVWYVSLALCPLLVAGALVVLCVVLFVNTLATGSVRRALAGLGKRSGRIAERDIRLVAIVALIAA